MGDDHTGIVANARAGWVVSAVSAGLVGFWLVLGGAGQVGQQGFRTFLETDYANIVFGLMFPAVGALILSRVPGHRLGWLYCLCGLATAITLASYAYAQRGLVDAPGSLPGALAAAWVSSWVWMCGFSPLLTLGVLGFPDGRLPSRRWWPIAAVSGVTIAVGVVAIALRPGPLENHPSRDNPLGVPALGSWVDTTLDLLWLPLLTVAIVASFASLLVRYRRGTTAERDQLRWLVVSVGLLVTSFAIPVSTPVGVVGTSLVILALPLMPLYVGVAVLRSRLDDLSVGVRRSVVYGWLLAAGLALYAAVVLTLDTILRGHAQPAVAVLGAGAVAVAYHPLRQRLQRSTDRMLYGDRGDPYAVSASLGLQLESFGSAAQALPAAVAAIAEALRLPYVAIELPGDPPQQPTAAYGSPTASPPVAIPLTHGGDNVGRLLVGQRDNRESLTRPEQRLLEDLGRLVAVATHAALLDRALRRSLDRLVLAREEERLRLRRDLHDGLGPALAGVALGVEAARNMMDTDRRGADQLLSQLKRETLGCVGDVRRIVDNLRPPALDELGLTAALTAFADRLSNRDHTQRVHVEAGSPLPELPAVVEVAAYLIATEAMTNVARHAQARYCSLRLVVAGDLTIEVSDDGVGIPTDHTPGIGLSSMAERATQLGGDCVVGRTDAGGTMVLAHLPLVAT
jgi:signal transduction histidine kinase